MRRGLVLIALCGCDALFGLDTVSFQPDAPPPARITVTGKLTRRWLSQNSTNEPLLGPIDLPSVPPLSVLLSDNSIPAMTWDPVTGAFTFEAALGERYRVTGDTGVGKWEYQVATPSLLIDDIRLGHPTQVAPQAAATVDWTTTNTTLEPGDLKFATLGVWSNTTPAATATAGKFSVSWQAATFYGGQNPASLSGPGHDSLFVLHYTSNFVADPGIRIFDSYAAFGNVSTSPTGTTSFGAMLAPLPRPYCIDMYWNHATDIARIRQLYPAYTILGADARLFATPFPAQIGIRSIYELALASSSADSHVAMNYGNPFNLDVVALDSAGLARKLSDGATVSVAAQYFDLVTPSTTCTRHDNPPEMAVFPVSPRLGGQALADDLVVQSDGNTPIELSWSLDPADVEVSTQVNLLRNSVLVRTYFTIDNHVFIDPRDLESGAQYRLHIVPARGTLPNRAAGDFATRAYPFTLGIFQSGFFSISKP